MDDLVQFLRDQLDEDERIARAAAAQRGGGEWQAEPDATGIVAVVGRYQPHESGYPYVPEILNPDYEETADHIARHDPARVLRDIEAKLRLMDLHRPYVPEVGQACLGCAGGIEFERCPVVRLLALPYADHPAYREEWRP